MLSDRIRPSDAALAAGFAAFALVEEFAVDFPGTWWPYALGFWTVLVLVRRRFPLLVMLPNVVAPTNGFYVEANIGGETTVNFRLWQVVVMMICAYTVGRWVPPVRTGRRDTLRGAAGLVLVLATFAMYWINDPEDPMATIFFPFAPYLLGIVAARQSRRSAQAAAVLAETRERQAREAVTEERVRIARELHDMVAHSVTVMVIQAGVVRRRLEAGLEVDHDLLRGIESGGREAVVELRRTLGLLRGEGGGDSTQPAPGLDRLDELVGQLREAGLRVTLRRTGDALPLLPAVDLSAYRIVQEALTNVLKHARAATAAVTLDYRPDGLHLRVENDGPVAAAPAGGGQGLIGMRERVALFGGDLEAAPQPRGGFLVRARLPALQEAR